MFEDYSDNDESDTGSNEMETPLLSKSLATPTRQPCPRLPLVSQPPVSAGSASLSTASLTPFVLCNLQTSLTTAGRPPASLPPTSLPPTSLPPTSLAPTSLAPTSLPPASPPQTSPTQKRQSGSSKETPHTQPDWLKLLHQNFQAEVLDKCSEQSKKAAENNEKIEVCLGGIICLNKSQIRFISVGQGLY